MKIIEVKKEWDEKQLNAFYFNSLIILFDLIYKKERIKEIFKLGGLLFSPSDSQINNWRKTKKHTPIFKNEYLTCFIRGLLISKNIPTFNFNENNKLESFYNLLITFLGFQPTNLPPAKNDREKLELLISFIINFKKNNNKLFEI